MHNRIGFNRLGRKSSHRKALHRNMVTSLIKYERIETTKAKAKEIRRTAEKLVTRAKVDSVHNRRIAAKTVYEKDMVNKLFTVVGPRFTERPGGYTRMLKLGLRAGDAAEMVILEFLKEEEGSTAAKKAPAKKKAASKSTGAKAASKTSAKSASGPKKAAPAKSAPKKASDKKDEAELKVAENKVEEAKAPEAEKPAEEAKAEAGKTDDAGEATKPTE